MSSRASLDTIVSRHLVLARPDAPDLPIDIAIGVPYARTDEKGMPGGAGCLVWTNDDPLCFTEVFGADEMEALICGLTFLENYLIQWEKTTNGRLRTLDGRPFDPKGSEELQAYRLLLL